MSRKRNARKELRPWFSAKPDCQEGRFIQVGNSLLLSKTFQSLTPSTQVMYLCMGMESGGGVTFQFPERAMKKYGINPRTGRRSIDSLVEKGFIELTSSGKNTRTASDYRFSSKWKCP